MLLLRPPQTLRLFWGLVPLGQNRGLWRFLRNLVLIDDGRWTTAAETILWRTQPQAWRLNVTSDPRFAGAVQQAIDFMPQDVAFEMNQIVIIMDRDIEAEMDRINAANSTSPTSNRSVVTAALHATPEKARRSLQFHSRYKLDWLFFCRWRFPDGWLKPQEAERTLKVFHDPLAIAMRRAVAAKRYPSLAFLKD